MLIKTPTERPLLMVAPNGARRQKKDHPTLPETISEIASTAAACLAAGADALHAHSRDENGKHVLDVGLSRELLQETTITAPNMPIQITTESVGYYSPDAQRQFLYALCPPHASVALGEMMADNDIKSASRLYHWATENHVDIQHILRHPNELHQLSNYMIDGTLPPSQTLSVLFVLGNYQTSSATPAMLHSFLQAHQQINSRQSFKIRFMACAFGKNETDCLLLSAKSGGDCRVGFENNIQHPNGEIATDNAERIREVIATLKQNDCW